MPPVVRVGAAINFELEYQRLYRSQDSSTKFKALDRLYEIEKERKASEQKADSKFALLKTDWRDRLTVSQAERVVELHQIVKAAKQEQFEIIALALTQKLRPSGPEDSDPAIYQPIPEAKEYDTTPPEPVLLEPEDRAVEPVVPEPEDDSYLDDISPDGVKTWRERGDYWEFHDPNDEEVEVEVEVYEEVEEDDEEDEPEENS